jgi:ABC-2 type transport system ATP-binding protein
MSQSAAYIQAENLHKQFGTLSAVQGVNLQVQAGMAYGLVGADGAGKTTLMRLLVGALTPTLGQVHILGIALQHQPELARAQIGYLAQRFSLYADLTVLENLRFFGEVRGIRGREFDARARELLGFVGLAGFENRLAGNLSGGMKQKLGLASALIHRPKVLLLDEPTGGVDPVTRQDFWQLLIGLVSEERIAVVVSTPYMDEAARCNRLGFLHHGKMLTEGTPRELTQAMQEHVVELMAHPKDLARQVAEQDVDVIQAIAFGDRLHLRVNNPTTVLARLPSALQSAGVQFSSLRPIAPTLEDAFISLLTEQV